jgi:hypothetical protein
MKVGDLVVGRPNYNCIETVFLGKLIPYEFLEHVRKVQESPGYLNSTGLGDVTLGKIVMFSRGLDTVEVVELPCGRKIFEGPRRNIGKEILGYMEFGTPVVKADWPPGALVCWGQDLMDFVWWEDGPGGLELIPTDQLARLTVITQEEANERYINQWRKERDAHRQKQMAERLRYQQRRDRKEKIIKYADWFLFSSPLMVIGTIFFCWWMYQ